MYIQLIFQVADATARMVEAAKGCASCPRDKDHQAALRLAAEDLRSATTSASNSALKKKIIKKLELAAKNAASSATQLINASGGEHLIFFHVDSITDSH